MTQNIKYLVEIRKWNTEQLIDVLEMNGLSDCSEAIRSLEIDGEAFLNLTEGQLAFWRKYLNNVQVRRFWSIIQLARERPKDFVGDIGLNKNPQQDIERIRSPIANSLENLLGPKLAFGSTASNNSLHGYGTTEAVLQGQSKLPYQKLPPKPPAQQNIRKPPAEEYLPMKSYHIEQIPQNPEVNVTKPNSFLHSNNRVLPSITTEETTSGDGISRLRRVPSPNNFSRPLPLPPQEVSAFPLPPNIVPLIPDWKIDINDEEYPIYDDVVSDDYKTKSWYSNIDRKQANALLKGRPNGTFIARPSKQENYECSLSIIYNDRIYNLGVVRQDHKLVIGNQEFDSVIEIIDYFMEHEMILNGDNNKDIVVMLRSI